MFSIIFWHKGGGGTSYRLRNGKESANNLGKLIKIGGSSGKGGRKCTSTWECSEDGKCKTSSTFPRKHSLSTK